MFYSKTTGGFYDPIIHADGIPEDAVEISAEEHGALLAQQSAGKVIGPDKDGLPKAFEPTAPVATWEAIRAKRDGLLSGCDWTQLADAPVDKAAWATYRQALRNITSTFAQPAAVIWPDKPE